MSPGIKTNFNIHSYYRIIRLFALGVNSISLIQVDLKDVPKSKGVSIGIQCNRYLDSSIPLEHKQVSRKTTYKQEKDETMDVDERDTDDHSVDLDYIPDSEEEQSSDLSDDEG